MLIPRKVKHRKQHHPKRSGAAKGGTTLAFGDFGIQALESHYVTNRQIESARIAMTRHIKRGGKVWIYKGDVAGSRAEREAQAAARAATQQRGRPARRDGGDRGDRGGRGGDRGGRRDDRRDGGARNESAPKTEAAVNTDKPAETTGSES